MSAVINSNPQLTFCRQMNDYRLDKDAWVLLVRVCCDSFKFKNSTLDMTFIQSACDQERLKRQNGERIRITGFC